MHFVALIIRLLSGYGKRGFLFIIFVVQLQLVTLSSFAQFIPLLYFGSKENGVRPYSAPVSDGTFLYGTTSEGGDNDMGTIYKIKPDGTGFAKLFDFNGTGGRNQFGDLLLDGGFLYGMTRGGITTQGNIYKIKTDGTGFANLLDFSYTATGAFPYGSLITDGTFLYGMTSQGGSIGLGTVFKIKNDGTGYVKLFEFDGGANGGNPRGALLSVGGSLYGMTSEGGSSGLGTIFKINPDGTGFAILQNFTGIANGSTPWGSLISDGTALYGMTISGGSNNQGALFTILPNGTGFARLLSFSNAGTGGIPKGSLVWDGASTLYGTTTQGGSNFYGTIFKIQTNGTGFLKLLDNDLGSGGPNPEGTLLLGGATLYGVKPSAGFGQGAIYKINTNGSGYAKLLIFEVAGNSPGGSLFSDGTFLSGMTSVGGPTNDGTIFKIKPDGTGFVRLLDFDGTLKGSRPAGSFISDGTFLYGMTTQGGANGAGTIFKIMPDGTGFVKLFDFNYATSGGASNGSLLYDATTNFLYGMAASGGANSYGTIFKIRRDGTGFAKLLDFDGTNGGNPFGSLIKDATFLYGMGSAGGVNGWGSIFKIMPNGTGFLKLHDFDSPEGANPKGSLVLEGTSLYGMTSSGGSNGYGTVFKIKSDGTGFGTLLHFDDSDNGRSPYGDLISDGTFLYGLTFQGGILSLGTMFKIKPDGSNYNKLLDFNYESYPTGSLISDGTFLYGMTASGGAYGLGALFKRSLAPSTTITNFTPTEGVEGTLVTIYGTDFNLTPAGNIVKFDNVTATVATSAADSLTVLVPVGATTGPISVTTAGTVTSITDFEVTDVALMFNGSVKNCNVQFVGPDNIGYDDDIETFLPVNPSDKVRVSFSSFDVGDILYVYDGPTTASPLIATLSGSTLPSDMVATGPGGELTFLFRWLDDTSDWEATISCQSSGPGITIGTQPVDFIACDGDVAAFSTSASGTTNINYHWQYSTDGVIPFADIANGGGYSNATTATLSVSTVGNFGAGHYRCRINGDLAAEVFTNDEGLFINPRPSPPTTVNPGLVCGPTTVDLTVSGGTNGQYVWYTVPTGGTAIVGQVNAVYTTPSLSATTTYYVAIDNGTCESTRTPATASVQICNSPTITPTLATAFIEGIVTIDLTNLIADPDGNLDLSTLQIVTQPGSGAVATLSGLILTINYAGFPFTSTDMVTLSVCDLTGLCTTQQIAIEFAGDITVFNAVSPNGDGKNDILFLQYIEVIPDKKQNQVRVYSRWGDEVFSISNYNNHDRVFTGNNNDGNKLPTGTYFYKISFSSGEKSRTGYLELKY